jgi:hypothetical protein
MLCAFQGLEAKLREGLWSKREEVMRRQMIRGASEEQGARSCSHDEWEMIVG